MKLRANIAVKLGSLELDVRIEAGEDEVIAVLGPNGAGKTTLLRAMAGLIPLDRGRVELDGLVLEDTVTGAYVPTERRPIGVVFQDYLLFPHLSVLANVAFGLRSRGMGRRDSSAKALEWLGRVGLESYADALPGALSGGQRQRVALVRALATEPRLLLLDEPLSALDASARADVRRDIRKHLATFKGTRLIVTHDPLEAVALADRLVVIEKGTIVQSGTPAEVTERPRTPYIADLVGVNLFRGSAADGEVRLAGGGAVSVSSREQGDVFAVIHPRSVVVHRTRPEGSSRNVWRGRADGIELVGDRARLRVEGEMPLVAEITPGAVSELRLAEGGEVWVSVKATEVAIYPA